MISDSKLGEKLSHKTIRCSICRSEIQEKATFHQSLTNFSVVCPECYRRFSEQDLDLIINLFNAFGGYFGKFKTSKFSIYKTLKELIKESQEKNKPIDLENVNIQMLHNALLHGLSPNEYVMGLKILLVE